jgi:hypothetical protein
MLRLFFLSFLLSVVSCQKQGRTDLIFSDLATTPGSSEIIDSDIPDAAEGPEAELEIQIILGDRYYMLNKFMDLFDIPANQMYPDHAQVTLYDKIKPALFEFGLMGGGCDFYASVNAWAPVPKEPLADSILSTSTAFSYKLKPGITQQFWQESCWQFHKNHLTFTGIPTLNWTQPVVSSAARFAAVMRVCNLVTKSRIEPFLTQKMGFDISAIPDFDNQNLKRLMEVFHPAYVPKEDEIVALSGVRTLFPETLTSANKLEMWRTATQAVCQSPFWHHI